MIQLNKRKASRQAYECGRRAVGITHIIKMYGTGIYKRNGNSSERLYYDDYKKLAKMMLSVLQLL